MRWRGGGSALFFLVVISLTASLFLALAVQFIAHPTGRQLGRATPTATHTPARVATRTAGATPTPTAGSSTPRARLVTTQTLDESCIDGPALWADADARQSALAWAGADPYHRLNVMTSGDGLHYSNQQVLHANARARPALAGATVNGARVLIVAWSGIDPNASLNIMYDVYGAQRVLTLPEGSPFGPALTIFDDKLWLAWAGAEAGHPLHIRSFTLSASGVQPQDDRRLDAYTSASAPELATDAQGKRLLLTWTANSDTRAINLAGSSDGATWSLLATPSAQTSVAGPGLLALSGAPSGMPAYYWTWSGTNAAHTLTLAMSSTPQTWPDPVGTLPEESLGSPQLGYLGVNGQILLAWSGADSPHHLNVGIVQV